MALRWRPLTDTGLSLGDRTVCTDCRGGAEVGRMALLGGEWLLAVICDEDPAGHAHQLMATVSPHAIGTN